MSAKVVIEYAQKMDAFLKCAYGSERYPRLVGEMDCLWDAMLPDEQEILEHFGMTCSHHKKRPPAQGADNQGTEIIVHSLGGAEEAFMFQRRDVAMAFLAGIIARTDPPQWRKLHSKTLSWGNQIHVYV